MSQSNIRELILEDIETLKSQTIPTLSAKEMYGTMTKYYGLFCLYIITISLGFELFFYKFHIGPLAKDPIGNVFGLGIMEAIGMGFILSIGFFFQIAPKAVIFNKAIRNMIQTGDLIASKLKKYMIFQMSLYALIIFLGAPIFGFLALANIPAFIICIFTHNFIENSEIQRLGIPEFPKLIKYFLEGHKSYR